MYPVIKECSTAAEEGLAPGEKYWWNGADYKSIQEGLYGYSFPHLVRTPVAVTVRLSDADLLRDECDFDGDGYANEKLECLSNDISAYDKLVCSHEVPYHIGVWIEDGDTWDHVLRLFT